MLADDHSHHDHTANLVASPSVASEAVYPSSQGQAAAVDPNLYYNNYQQVHTQTTISKISIISVYRWIPTTEVTMTTTPRTPGSWARTMRTGAQWRSRQRSCLSLSHHVTSLAGPALYSSSYLSTFTVLSAVGFFNFDIDTAVS